MGHCHDLEAIMRELCATYFPQCTEVTISWGRWSGRVRPHSMRLGVYQPQKQVIRIHPALDQAFVPRYFVEFIVYHELLHHVIPPMRINGRYCVHSVAFRGRERAFPRYAQAIAWRKQHLRRLLESNRRGHV
jgi:predicted metal-dependent hydrolase